jgi:N-acetylmuramoyl-L-alanine amidase
MPSVLVETGFITNREEEDYLNSKEGQQEISKCVTEAVKNYIGWLEKQQQPLNSSTQNTNSTSEAVKDSRAFLDMIEKKENNSF